MAKSDSKTESGAVPAKDVRSLQGTLEREFESPAAAGAGKKKPRRSPETSQQDTPQDGVIEDQPATSGSRTGNNPETDSSKAEGAEKISPPNIGLPVTFGSLVANLLGLAMPLVILQVYDRIIPNQAIATFTLLILGLVCALCLEAIMRTARAWLTGWSAVGYEVAVARANMENILTMPTGTVAREPESEFLARLSAIDTLRQFYGGQSRLLLIDLPFVCLFLGLIWTIAGPLVFVPVFLFGAFGALTIRHGAALRRLLSRRNVYDSMRQDFSIHSLSDLGAIKSQVGEAFFHRRHDRHSRTGSVINYETVVLGAEAHSLSAVFSNVAIVTVVSFGAYHVISGQLSIGALAAVTLLTGRAMQPLVRALGMWSQIQSLHIAKTRISELHELRKLTVPPEQSVSAKISGAATLTDVKVAQPGSEDPVLDVPGFVFGEGELSVVRCSDGRGARELAELLAGEFEPQSGLVCYASEDGEERPAGRFRDQIALVSDPPAYFDGSILNNISMFRNGPALDRALEASRRLGFDAYVEQLPDGFETAVVSGVATQLPAGVVQMMAIVRALATQPRVLILLDPLSRLDRRSQRNVLTALDSLKGEMTIVVFSHHTAFEKIGDRVLELRGGRLRRARLAKTAPVAPPAIKVGQVGNVAHG